MKINYKKIGNKIAPGIFALIFTLGILGTSFIGIFSVNAQVNTLTTVSNAENPTQSSFKIVICDGPAGLNDIKNHTVVDPNNPGKTLTVPTGWKHNDNFIPCDFNGAMIQIQHLINLAMVLGVFAAIVLFTYAGFLMITGKESDMKKAKDIFPKVGIGFIVMLTAWFIVFQIVSWLTGAGIFTKLLGNP